MPPGVDSQAWTCMFEDHKPKEEAEEEAKEEAEERPLSSMSSSSSMLLNFPKSVEFNTQEDKEEEEDEESAVVGQLNSEGLNLEDEEISVGEASSVRSDGG